MAERLRVRVPLTLSSLGLRPLAEDRDSDMMLPVARDSSLSQTVPHYDCTAGHWHRPAPVTQCDLDGRGRRGYGRRGTASAAARPQFGIGMRIVY